MLTGVDYNEVRAAFFQPRSDGAVPTAEQGDLSPGRRLRRAIEPIATISFWSEPAYEAYVKLGLDFLGGYVLSRSCPMGEPEAEVVAAAFGVFEPAAIAGLYGQARATTSVAAMRVARLEGARTALDATIGASAEVGPVVDVLRRAAAAAAPVGRPLHAGLAALEWPDDRLGQLWHACSILREHRGDGHLAACVTNGLDGVEANILTELLVGWSPFEYTGTRAWSPEAMAAAWERLESRGFVAEGALTDAGRELRNRVEAATEASVASAVAAIGPDLDHVVDAAEAWSEQIIERGWFPPDPFKRAAG